MSVVPSLIFRTSMFVAYIFFAGSEVGAGEGSLPGVQVEAPRDPAALKHDMNEFVSSAIVQSREDESLERWTYEPICPLVAGLNKAKGEFILGRISNIAKAVGAPLGSEKCRANFFVIVSADPESGLKRVVSQKGGQTFNYETNGNKLKKFIETPRPIRIWYNAGVTSIDGVGMVSGILDTSSVQARESASAQGLDPIVNTMPSMYGSRLNISTTTRDILSVIVVVDSKKLEGLNVGQLGDYIGMIGLAQVNLDGDFGNASTILNLFRGPLESRPKEMTEWDKALLRALYTTSQRSKMQVSEMQTAALKEIMAATAH